ncbi:Pentatricopeptide repeat-containing protein [Acorus gramineus]|uniref:Pentatricopeptide repeat-containing protein n=1 Tax=Acorus gramineus TaxID=55184 RepID=A0AAV9B586_ACOGR|nr:Pentatricopeptide repeat-containing protein [Acorus gramineus]
MTVGLSIPPAKTPTIPSNNNNNNKRRPKTISTFPTDPKTLLLNQCNTQRDLHQLHAHLIKTHHLFSHNPSLPSQYLLESAALSRHGSLAYALSIFRHIDRPTAPAYNILIRAFNVNRSMRDSLALYDRMRADSVEPDEHTFSCALKSCSMLGAFQEAEQIHAHVVKFGFGSNGFVKNTLIHVYATCGDLEIARRVFDGMREKGIVTWNSMIAGYSKSGDWGSVLDLFYEMRRSGISFDEVTMISVLSACGRLGDLGLGEWMDGYIVENGLTGNRNLVTSLIDMYAKCGEIDKAYRWFEGMRNRDVVAWSAMISGYSQSNRCLEALMLFQEMRKADVEPNEVTMVSVLSSCAVLGAFETGKWVHSFIRKNRLRLTVTLGTTLIDFYAKCGFIENSIQVFQSMPEKNVLSYNILIRAFNVNRSMRESLALYDRMRADSVEPDEHTFSCALKSCSMLGAFQEAEQIHAHVVKFGFGSNGFVKNTLIHVYATCGDLEIARRVFDGMREKGIVTWNSMIAGYSKSGDWGSVLDLFYEMRRSGISFDEVTMISVLSACGRLGDLGLGAWMDGYIVENGLTGNRNLVTSLIDMYAKCGEIDKAYRWFEGMCNRDVVAWSAMISGYSQSNRCLEALMLFQEMRKADVEPNEVTMVSVLSSCAVLGAFETGKWVHSFIRKNRLRLTVTLGTTLIDFYAKCGFIENSIQVFQSMPEKNVLSWTVLIQGLASNSRGRDALDLFSSMRRENVKPNEVTFIGVLTACSHTGLVEEGRRVFASMRDECGIEPRMDHYGSMVDILGRAGLIDEAYEFIKSMPIEPNAIVWRTLLASCRIHKNVEIGELSLKELVRMEPKHSGDYILLSNIYASKGRWEEALRVRGQMEGRGVKKTPGCSLIEVEGTIHEFFAEDTTHPRARAIYDKVEEMMGRIKSEGYRPNTAEARLDAEEDEKEASVSHHSEKLAIAFGLIQSSPGATIRVSKNLRVCTDCHSATKLISKVYEREIVVRDRNRFHHFRNGSCSCKDYW